MVNVVGLSVMLASLLLSAGYINRELRFDRHHAKADRIVRLALQEDDNPVDGRIWGNALDALLRQMPRVEQVVKMSQEKELSLTHKGESLVVENAFRVSRGFRSVFDLPLVAGGGTEVLERGDQVLISERLARALFHGAAADSIVNSALLINNDPFFVSGIFKDIPATSHFQADVFLLREELDKSFAYTYLLLKTPGDLPQLEQQITALFENDGSEEAVTTRALLMPLTDIHLHIHNLREMSVNGFTYYIYLIAGANVLLLLVVLFNLWLNTTLIYSKHRHYYQVLRFCGAPKGAILRSEWSYASLTCLFSLIIGSLLTYLASARGFVPGQTSFANAACIAVGFVVLVLIVATIPAIKPIASLTYLHVRWMLIIQYTVVMAVAMLAFGFNKQMNLVKRVQVGGDDASVLVLKGLSGDVWSNVAVLREKLLSHNEIKGVTFSFQLPGDAVRDGVMVCREGDTQWNRLPVMIVGQDFLPFFDVPLAAGRDFSPLRNDYPAELKLFTAKQQQQLVSDQTEEYLVNSKALSVLGFDTPESAIGATLRVEQGTIDYYQKGVIVGVTEDFNYTGVYQESIPLLMMQRNLFLFNAFIRLDKDRPEASLALVEQIWKEVNPDIPLNYTFLNQVFSTLYRDELNAKGLVDIFSLLSFLFADLGLIVFMAFIVRRRRQEMAIRKINGASSREVVRLLTLGFVRYIAVAFVIAVPVTYFVLTKWMERFAYRTSLGMGLYLLVGLFVLLISLLSISLQSWRAASLNPVESLKS